ncbi:MAG TPA: 4-hydroxythreonine-4-phosphate dehydrogenase PdxA [Sulfurihydrogenibium sp.]|uniref:4-hydroxythreonine-4-phosphate dehydrogenase n=1 Tax=Sulfurihydrogenibium sp. (strain YO3AOP1) TaxID=436114 RepID=PDXA_SULSY|nr:4-hydroxythreonine-4-phosphate dehydrogenase PdxA [Sulfurihydrogenibium sp. YO3AOP1]B2V9E6.1 RecName: Full=4-hydroxythreonine-4-phosphate dehydrogenase; AltName: Full=4-(phosphohydroxy)-L-threonine dehydrogenase [Sulfurihydrogenibium sp. YO3AOP1]ACD66569.1 4-hydroxythreonine-4-phosphate dehydrogenase [Sulfurihydrogenibium sp. YO3AOP1]HBT98932.1 4-hydroxythreonine-4-phosphate dehydrogenase PdxA [Sulfurihydrogenibium sp.]
MVKLAITLGDPSGINSEILLKALNKLPKRNISYVIYGSKKALEKAKKLTGVDLNIKEIKSINDVVKSGIYLINLYDLDVEFGSSSKETGKASVVYLENAVKDVLEKKADALITLPISKQWIMESGFPYAGHTDYLAEVSGAKEYAMVLMCKKLKVALITTHIPLKDVPSQITKEKIISKVRLINREFKEKFGISKPKIAILGLNPHASDNGNIGNEEQNIILPAVKTLREDGIEITDPLSPDTAFNRYKDFDIYVAMYHDQGLIPLKLLCFRKAVNITLGLPFIRTSPDHGTGYDIAGKNIADPSSTIEAVELAILLKRVRK